MPRRSPFLLALVALLLAAALFLGVGGVRLALLGGSWYYVLAAAALLATALLLIARRPAALHVHAVLMFGTLAWALWESGLDWWPLAARGDVLFVFGVLLLLPWITRPLGTAAMARRGGLALAASLALFAAVGVASWFHDPHAVAGQIARARVAAPTPTPTPTPTPAAAAAAAAAPAAVPPGEWHAYGRTAEGQRYSPLDQITVANAEDLTLAWHYRTGDVRGQPGDPEETTFQVTPLKVGNRLFLCTPHQSVVALDATTGEQAWRRDLGLPTGLALQHLTCRGLSYQPSSSAPECPAKLFMPTADGRLLALDPATGKSCSSFGGGRGEIDLWANMPNPKPGAYYSTSPVVVTQKLVIVGGTVLDNVSTREQSGVIRAYDIETGALVWNWDSARPDDTAPIGPGQTYTPNSPNSWSISSVDEALGMVYVPLGNQPPDQWGGNRSEAVERFSSSVVALDLASGRVRWHFQTVHHDLWDYDVPAQPSLIDLEIGGARIPALVQPTKQGELFVLDRRTGVPVHPVREDPVPQGAAAGDRTAPTQPRSAVSFDPPALTESAMWGATMFDQLTCRIAFKKLRYEGRYTSPSTQGTLVYPGNFGVFNWGGVAVDPARQSLFATPTTLAFVSKLVPRSDDTSLLVQGDKRPKDSLPALNENFGAPFAVQLSAFTSALGIPCQQPPWGFVAGVDLVSGKTAWMHRNGTVRDLAPVPLPFRMGVPNLGGPLLTAGGVAFLTGTLDYYLRIYDAANGKEIWKTRLPAGGQSTPMTYTGADGRQYVLAVAGGHGSLGTKAGDHVMAWALPKR
jgi:quinoprotein glucose dehydrogenase